MKLTCLLIIGFCFQLTLSQRLGKVIRVVDNFPFCPNKLSIATPNTCFSFSNLTSCYCLIEKEATWASAHHTCRLSGMELVSIETGEENLAIALQLAPRGGMMWTSGIRQPVRGNTTISSQNRNWIWSASGEPIGYTAWYVEPREEDNNDFLQLRFDDKKMMRWNNIGNKPTDGRVIMPLCEVTIQKTILPQTGVAISSYKQVQPPAQSLDSSGKFNMMKMYPRYQQSIPKVPLTKVTNDASIEN